MNGFGRRISGRSDSPVHRIVARLGYKVIDPRWGQLTTDLLDRAILAMGPLAFPST